MDITYQKKLSDIGWNDKFEFVYDNTIVVSVFKSLTGFHLIHIDKDHKLISQLPQLIGTDSFQLMIS